MIFGHQNDAGQPGAITTTPAFDASQAQSQIQANPAPAVASSSPGFSVQQSQPAVTAGMNPLAIDPDTGAPLPVTEEDTPHMYGPGPAGEPSILNQAPAVSYGSAATDDGQSSFANDPAPTTPFGDSQASSFAPEAADPAQQPAAMTEPFAGQPGSHLTPSFTTFTDDTAAPSQPDPQAIQAAPPADDYAGTGTPAIASLQTDTDNDDLLSIKQQALSQLGPLVNHLDQSPEEKFRTTMMLIQTTDNQALLHDAYVAAQAITDEKARAQALLDVVNEINYFTQSQPAG